MESNHPIIIYEANSRGKQSWIATWKILFQNIFSYKELIWQLFRRDFLMAYKKSFLGMSWIFIAPVMGIVSWVFMNATGILEPGDVGIPYPAYVLISSSMFGLFMSFYSGASGTLSAGSGFINQVNFPHDVLLVKQCLQALANFTINIIITFIFLLFFGVYPSILTLYLPLFILPIFFLGASIGLISSVISVVATDINRGIGMLMGLLLYVTPVIYSSKIENPFLQQIIKYNPLSYLIGGMRDAVIYGRIEHLNRYFIASVISFVIFLITWRVFYISEQKVIEKMI